MTLAKLCGWLTYHTYDSRRSDPGFPDCVFVRGERLIWAELKAQDGVTSAEQREWIARLRAAGETVVVWRPNDWPEIERTLAR